MKKYEYDGKIYCEEDLSEEIDNYGGDLWDFFWELERNREAGSEKLYWCGDFGDCKFYTDIEEMIEEECKEYEVDE